MAKKKVQKVIQKKIESNPVEETAKRDFHLSDKHYEEIEQFKIFESEKRIAKVFGIRNRKTGEELINIKSKSNKPFGIGWKFNWGVSLFDFSQVNNLFRGLRIIAKRLGWQGIEQFEDIEELKTQLREKEESILTLERANEEERNAHNQLIDRFREEQNKILKSKKQDFQNDIDQLKLLIPEAGNSPVPESELQEFLFNHSWLLGTEYINAEPQKLRGAHSKFDFYLERFNRTRDIVEIKLLSDQIINRDGTISAKVIQAVDQIIEYMESSIAAAHSSVISKEEGIQELRPRGIVIIGSDKSEEAVQKLHKWNYQFTHITILTYDDILEKASSVLKHI